MAAAMLLISRRAPVLARHTNKKSYKTQTRNACCYHGAEEENNPWSNNSSCPLPYTRASLQALVHDKSGSVDPLLGPDCTHPSIYARFPHMSAVPTSTPTPPLSRRTSAGRPAAPDTAPLPFYFLLLPSPECNEPRQVEEDFCSRLALRSSTLSR